MKSIFNKNFKTIFIILIIDIIIIGSWILYIRPESSGSLVLIYAIPFLFLVNLVIAVIIFFIKKYYTPFFILNAFLSSIMLFCFFVLYTKIDIKKDYTSWNFRIDNINYEISYSSFHDANNYWAGIVHGDGFYQGYDMGKVKKQNDTIYFFSKDSSERYYIYKDYLYNFKGIDKIRIQRK